MTLRPTMTSDFRPYAPSFTMPIFSHEHPYGMPPSMMAGLKTNVSTLGDNTTAAYSPLLASGLAISNLGRTTQPQLGMGFASKAMSTFTINSKMAMSQQMNESNHEMVNLLT